MKKLYLVVPCYNEELVLKETNLRLGVLLHSMIESETISESSRIVYIDDGSIDNTWELIKSFNVNDSLIQGIKLSRNKGHQNALLAGLFESAIEADIVISLDADLQDDIEIIPEMVKEHEKGNDIVYAVRNNRDSDSMFKRASAELFYKSMKFLGVDLVFNHADYRLLSKRVIKELELYPEKNLFLRGLIPTLGFPSTKVYYRRNHRFAGETKYPLKKMISFALEGITSFSNKPLKIISMIGMALFTISIGIIFYTLFRYFTNQTVTGWAFLNISIWLLSGIQLLALGIVGEYISKIYIESKNRPRYHIQEKT